MALGDLVPTVWRIDVYEMKPTMGSGYISDLSNFYTSDLSITRQRNYPDEIRFTLDLQQLEERAKLVGTSSRQLLEPYIHKVKIYRNNKFMAQAIVNKVEVNLNNESKNTIEVSCVDILGLLEKRLIHQDYGEGSWADIAAKVIMDAQHEPNRIYNYAFEGDGTAIDNAWFRGWSYATGDTIRDIFKDWEPNHHYNMYDKCTYDAKFWEAKEHAFVSGETFSESNWTLLGIMDAETGDVAGAYAVWREDEEEPGPSGTTLGGWAGTSSCHMSGQTVSINNGSDVTSIDLAGSEVSTSLVAPLYRTKSPVPSGYTELEYVELDSTQAFTLNEPINQTSSVIIDMQVDGSSVSSYPTILGTQIKLEKSGDIGDYEVYSHEGGERIYFYYVEEDIPKAIDDEFMHARHVYKTEANKFFIDGKVFMIADYANDDGTPDEYESIAPLGIGCVDYGDGPEYPINGKLYSIEIVTNRELVLRLIPCKRNSDGEVGLYDAINQEFVPATIGTPIAGPAVDAERLYDGKQFYSRIMVKNAGEDKYDGVSTSTIKLFVEGYGGTPKTYSPEFTVEGFSWQAVEYLWPAIDYDVYRFGFKIVSGDMLVDTPVVYWQPIEGDEWDLGIRLGEFPTDEEQARAGWRRDRFTPTYEWKNAKETLLDLSNMDSDNFWYNIDENYRFNVWVDQGSKEVTVNLSYPKNITSMTVSTNANDVFNYAKGDGSSEVRQDPLVSGVQNANGAPFTWIEKDDTSMAKYWALAEAASYNSERTIENLRTNLRSEIATSSIMQDVPTVKISNNAVTPDQIGLGDIVSVEAIGIPYVQRVNGLYKIVGYDIKVDIDGNESISLTLLNPSENQINALSFPQLIKNLVNRLRGTR